MIFKLDVHAEMTLEQLATSIADTIPNGQIIKIADNFQGGKFIPPVAYYSKDPWDAALWQMVNGHLFEHQFTPIKAILIIMGNAFVDSQMYHYPRVPIGDLSSIVGDGEITRAYAMLIGEIKRVMLDRYKTPESINIVRKEAS